MTIGDPTKLGSARVEPAPEPMPKALPEAPPPYAPPDTFGLLNTAQESPVLLGPKDPPALPQTNPAQARAQLQEAKNTLTQTHASWNDYTANSFLGLNLGDRLTSLLDAKNANGYTQRRSAYESSVDALYHSNKGLALEQLARQGGPEGYLHFDRTGRLSVRSSKPSGYSDLNALNGLSLWVDKNASNLTASQLDAMKTNARALLDKSGGPNSSKALSAYTGFTNGIYKANQALAESSMRDAQHLGWGDKAQGGGRYLTFDALGNAAIHDIKPKDYDRSKNLQAFGVWLKKNESSGTQLSAEHAADLRRSSDALHTDAGANAGVFQRAGRAIKAEMLGKDALGNAQQEARRSIERTSPGFVADALRRNLYLQQEDGSRRNYYLDFSKGNPSIEIDRGKSVGKSQQDFVQHISDLQEFIDRHPEAFDSNARKGANQYLLQTADSYRNRLASNAAMEARLAAFADFASKDPSAAAPTPPPAYRPPVVNREARSETPPPYRPPVARDVAPAYSPNPSSVSDEALLDDVLSGHPPAQSQPSLKPSSNEAPVAPDLEAAYKDSRSLLSSNSMQALEIQNKLKNKALDARQSNSATGKIDGKGERESRMYLGARLANMSSFKGFDAELKSLQQGKGVYQDMVPNEQRDILENAVRFLANHPSGPQEASIAQVNRALDSLPQNLEFKQGPVVPIPRRAR